MIETYNSFKIIIVIASLCVVGGFAQTQGAEVLSNVNIEPQEKWQTVFGGQECIYHFQVTSIESIEGYAGWSLRYANRTIARGGCTFEAGPGKGSLIKIQINVPSINEGVMIPAQLVVTLYQKGDKQVLASWKETLRIFSKEAFAFKKEWLKGLKVGLFDPEKTTQDIFKDLEIPFLLQNNIDALSEFDGALLVVGSGLDFAEYRSLWEEILDLCTRKISVLVLTPSGGTVSVPGVKGVTLPKPVSMRFLERSIIHELDKKLDADAWPPDGKVVFSSMMLKTTRAGLVGEFVPGDKGWPWFEANFADKGGKVVVCGFGIMEQIEAGPTPRFLLAQLFEYLTKIN